MKAVVIGLGNDIMRDDALGLRVAMALGSHPSLPSSVEVVETGEMGLSLLDFLVGKEWALIVDSVITEEKPVGYIHRIDSKDTGSFPTRNPHNMGIEEILDLGRGLGLDLPREVIVMAMEVKENDRFGDEMTREAEAGFAPFLDAVLQEIRRHAPPG